MVRRILERVSCVAVVAVVAVVVLAGVSPARADAPTVADVQAVVKKLRDAMPNESHDQVDLPVALNVLAAPLWYEGFGFPDIEDKKLVKRCKKQRRTTFATFKAISDYLDCFASSDWSYSIDGPDGDFEPVDVKHLPSVFRKYKAKLGKLAKDHTLAVTHFCPAAPGDFWTLYAAKKDAEGYLRIDTLLVANEQGGECRDK